MDAHVIFEPVTDIDKNLDTLARVKADCTYRQYYNICKLDCNKCKTNSKFNLCFNQLAICDQLRVNENAKELAINKIAYYRYYRINRIKNKTLLIFIFSLLVILFFIGVSFAHADTSIMKAYKNDRMITATLVDTHTHVHDCNDDGLVNCIDYTMQFKKEWDKKYTPKNCEIVRNNNGKNGFHHMFIRCRKDEMADWVYVEPQGTYLNYDMYDFWNDRYECFWNIYGETELWMRRYIK